MQLKTTPANKRNQLTRICKSFLFFCWKIREKEPSLVPENMTAEDFATPNDAGITTSTTLTDEKILQEATLTQNDEVEETKDDDEELVAPTT